MLVKLPSDESYRKHTKVLSPSVGIKRLFEHMDEYDITMLELSRRMYPNKKPRAFPIWRWSAGMSAPSIITFEHAAHVVGLKLEFKDANT